MYEERRKRHGNNINGWGCVSCFTPRVSEEALNSGRTAPRCRILGSVVREATCAADLTDHLGN